MRFPIAEDMRLRTSCSAYAYACCQVSTSSLAAGVGVIGAADGAHHKEAVDAGCLKLRQVGRLDAAAHHDGHGACRVECGQVLKALGDDRAIGRASAVALGLGLVERADAQVVEPGSCRRS